MATGVVNILTWAWDDYPRIDTVKKEVANKLSVFRNAKVGNHIIDGKGDTPVIRFRTTTSMAMKLLLEFLETGKVPNLEDSYYYPALPDLLAFIKEKVTMEEYCALEFEIFYYAITEKMFLSLTRPDDTNIEETKAAIVKYAVTIPMKYEGYF